MFWEFIVSAVSEDAKVLKKGNYKVSETASPRGQREERVTFSTSSEATKGP